MIFQGSKEIAFTGLAVVEGVLRVYEFKARTVSSLRGFTVIVESVTLTEK